MITSETKAGRFVIATPTKCATTTLEELARRHRGGRGGEPLDSFRILDWESPRRQHRMCPPESWAGSQYKVYMTVRDPFARWVSIYHYLKAPHNYTKALSREIQGREWGGSSSLRGPQFNSDPLDFRGFLTLIVRKRREMQRHVERGNVRQANFYRSPWVWLDGLDWSYTYLNNSTLLDWGLSGGGDESEKQVNLIRVERLWEDLSAVKEEFNLEALWLRKSIHANKALTYPPSLAGQTSALVRHYFDGDMACAPEETRTHPGGRCAWTGSVDSACVVCQIGVGAEAELLGYSRRSGGDKRSWS